MGEVIALANQKGGTGKTATTINLAAGMAKHGKNVLIIDGDPQGHVAVSLGVPYPDELDYTLSNVMEKIINGEEFDPSEGIIMHEVGLSYMPANIDLAETETKLVLTMNRERILKEYIDSLRDKYDFVLIDCLPGLGTLLINSFVASDIVLIPVQVDYLPAKGLEQLLESIVKVRRQINPTLSVGGIILTMADNRTILSRKISDLIRDTYGGSLKVFDTVIPRSTVIASLPSRGETIFEVAPKSKAAEAFEDLTLEVLENV